MLVPSDIVVTPVMDTKRGKTIERSIKYTVNSISGVTQSLHRAKKPNAKERKKIREAAMAKSRMESVRSLKTSGDEDDEDSQILLRASSNACTPLSESPGKPDRSYLSTASGLRSTSSAISFHLEGVNELSATNSSIFDDENDNEESNTPRQRKKLPPNPNFKRLTITKSGEVGIPTITEDDHNAQSPDMLTPRTPMSEADDFNDDEDYGDDVVELNVDEFADMMDSLSAAKKRPEDEVWNKQIKEPGYFSDVYVKAPGENPDLNLRFAGADMVGPRPTQEDRHFMVGSLSSDGESLPRVGAREVAFFGVYDGHNGDYVSESLQQRFHAVLRNVLLSTYPRKSRMSLKLKGLVSQKARAEEQERIKYKNTQYWLSQGIYDACSLIDRDLLVEDFKRQKAGLQTGTVASEVFGGAVAVMLAITRDARDPAQPVIAIVAHVGDCRAVLSNDGLAEQLTFDHKPAVPAEKKRIEAAGGWVHNNRVNGLLAVARSFGDINYKAIDEDTFNEECEQAEDESRAKTFERKPSCRCIGTYVNSEWMCSQQVISLPETKEFVVEPTHEFVILASDGVWDVFSNQEAVNLARYLIRESDGDLRIATQKFIVEAEVRQSHDNTTIVICALNQNNS
jgi:serine/threonine protein phosphatase PrpC